MSGRSDHVVPDGRAWARLEALRARGRYAWNNDGSAAVLRLHRLLDRPGRRVDVVHSVAGPHGPSVAYAGIRAGVDNVLALVESLRDGRADGVATRRTERLAWRDLAGGHRPDADLVLVGAAQSAAAGLRGPRTLVAPFRVHLVVDLPRTVDELEQRISKRERWEFRRNSRRHDWTLRESGSAELLDMFYARMHVPTMAVRHGERRRSELLSVAASSVLRSGSLFVLEQSGTPVAGVLCARDRRTRTLTTRLLGVLDGDEAHYESGAFKAVYHLLLREALSQGMRHVDFFGTEAFLSKGIFQWKRKFGVRVAMPPNHFADKRLVVVARRDTPAVRDFLHRNPLLTCAAGGLEPVYFADAARPARVSEVSARCDGVLPPRVVSMDEFFGRVRRREAAVSTR